MARVSTYPHKTCPVCGYKMVTDNGEMSNLYNIFTDFGNLESAHYRLRTNSFEKLTKCIHSCDRCSSLWDDRGRIVRYKSNYVIPIRLAVKKGEWIPTKV